MYKICDMLSKISGSLVFTHNTILLTIINGTLGDPRNKI